MDEVSWNRGAEEAYVQLKFSIMDSGLEKVGECTTVDFWKRCARGAWYEARGEIVGFVSNRCSLRVQDLQAGLAGISSSPTNICC